MKQKVYQKEFVRLFLDTEDKVIFEQWNGHITLNEFRDALEKKLELFIEHRKQIPDLQWLNDTTGLRGLSEEAQDWAVAEFHPRLYPAGVRRIAFIVPEPVYLKLDEESIMGKMDAAGQINLCYFDNFEDSVAWLQQG